MARRAPSLLNTRKHALPPATGAGALTGAAAPSTHARPPPGFPAGAICVYGFRCGVVAVLVIIARIKTNGATFNHPPPHPHTHTRAQRGAIARDALLIGRLRWF